MKERITYANYVLVPLKYTDPAGERAYGPAWYEIMKAEEEYVKQERYNAYMCGMNNLHYHDTFEMMFFNSICTWGDNGPANTGGGHDTTHSGIGETKDKDGNMIPDENKPVPDGRNGDGKTPETAMNAENLFITCYVNYIAGNNRDIYVDASSMTEKLSKLNIEEDFTDWGNGKYTINLFDHFSECSDLALALGNIELNYIGDNMYMIKTDDYDFNLNFNEQNGNFEWTKRNVFTFLGGIVHYTYNDRTLYGISGAFKIHFEGNVYINPRP